MANNLNIDLTNKRIILSSKHYKGDEEEREFFCECGFGCKPYTSGRGIFGYFIKDKEQGRVEGYEVEKLGGKNDNS